MAQHLNENGRPEIIVPLDDFDGMTADCVSIEMFGTADQWGPDESVGFYEDLIDDRLAGPNADERFNGSGNWPF